MIAYHSSDQGGSKVIRIYLSARMMRAVEVDLLRSEFNSILIPRDDLIRFKSIRLIRPPRFAQYSLSHQPDSTKKRGIPLPNSDP
jgi:hypothetical protein